MISPLTDQKICSNIVPGHGKAATYPCLFYSHLEKRMDSPKDHPSARKPGLSSRRIHPAHRCGLRGTPPQDDREALRWSCHPTSSLGPLPKFVLPPAPCNGVWGSRSTSYPVFSGIPERSAGRLGRGWAQTIRSSFVFSRGTNIVLLPLPCSSVWPCAHGKISTWVPISAQSYRFRASSGSSTTHP
jgi:hypothetical protein